MNKACLNLGKIAGMEKSLRMIKPVSQIRNIKPRINRIFATNTTYSILYSLKTSINLRK